MTVNEIYNNIGQVIVDSIQEDWVIAILNINRLDKYVAAQCKYENIHNQECIMDDSELGYSFSLLIHELYSITTEGGHNRWNKLKFILYPTGKFEMDFIWDQEYQDKIDNAK
jgi:hypothetical protein